MDIGDILFNEPGIVSTLNRYLRMPGNAKSATGGRYKKSRKVSRKLTPFKRYNAKAMVARAKTKTLTKLIKAVQLKDSETCYRTYKLQSFALYHNSIAAHSIWYPGNPIGNNLFPTQGNTDGNRKGDEIICQGIRLRMVLNVPYDRRNTTFKMFFIQWNSVQGNVGLRTDLLHDITGNIMLDPIQKDRWPGVKYLGSYTSRAKDLQGTDHHTILVNRWLPLKRKVTFLTDGNVEPANLREYGSVVIFSYSTTGALETDAVATNCQFTATLYYKDP